VTARAPPTRGTFASWYEWKSARSRFWALAVLTATWELAFPIGQLLVLPGELNSTGVVTNSTSSIPQLSPEIGLLIGLALFWNGVGAYFGLSAYSAFLHSRSLFEAGSTRP
jgi:hypothetical protein